MFVNNNDINKMALKWHRSMYSDNFDARPTYHINARDSSLNNDIDGLEKWKHYVLQHIYPKTNINNISEFSSFTVDEPDRHAYCASSSGLCHVKVTTGWLLDVVKYASGHGHTEILDWWYQNSDLFEFHYDEAALYWASFAGHIHVLDWWYNHSDKVLGDKGLKLKYNKSVISFKEYRYNKDSESCRPSMALEGSGVAKYWLPDAITVCNNKAEVLGWWFQHSKQVLGDKGLDIKD